MIKRAAQMYHIHFLIAVDDSKDFMIASFPLRLLLYDWTMHQQTVHLIGWSRLLARRAIGGEQSGLFMWEQLSVSAGSRLEIRTETFQGICVT